MSAARGEEPQVRVGTPARNVGPAGEMEILSEDLPPPSQLNDALVVGLSILAAVCGLIFGIGVTVDWPLPLYGTALAVGLFALAYATRRYFADRFPDVEAIEPRLQFTDPDLPEPETSPSDIPDVHAVGRRPLLRWALLGSAATFGVGLLAPISTLGPRVGDELRSTAWRPGRRLVTDRGELVRPDDLPPGGVTSVWPEGAINNEFSSTLLLRLDVDPEPPTNLEWVVNGRLLAYSKVCTHAGCPVALYREQDEALFCPCHQSTFDVVHGARPTFGPAARNLPQLPLGVDEEGYLVALDDFQDQVGPAYG
jgi:quinol---cytochrome c reductase iron-sulfur subunit